MTPLWYRVTRVVRHEHGLWDRKKIGRYDRLETWYERNVTKSGRIGNGLVEHNAWYTPINTCFACGKIGVPKNVRFRADATYWPSGPGWIEKSRAINGELIKGEDLLCTGCWNKKRSFVKKIYEADEVQRLINQLKKEIRNERKNQNNRTNAGVSGDDDVRC